MFDITVPHVCDDCNHSWMSDIEGNSKPHVLPMILGDYSKKLSGAGLEHIVRWCYLKVLTLELARPSEHTVSISASAYRDFRVEGLPSILGVSLALGARERITDPNPDYVAYVSQSLNQPSGPSGHKLDWHETSILIGHLAVSAVCVPYNRSVDANHGEGFQVIWPTMRTGGSFTWPPHKRLRGEIIGRRIV
jgi:hypothetical protein